MTYAPSSLLSLRSYLMAQTGASAVALGIVGDAAHAKRASYHNGWDRVLAYGRTAATDYSIRLPRDRALPRTNAAAAIDIGRPAVAKGGYAALRKMSVWLVAQARAGAPGTQDIREIIYSPDGRVVKRWDNAAKRLYDGYPNATGQGDSSHLWHTHVSYYRDSEKRDKVALFKRYYQPAPPPPYTGPAYRVTIPSGKPTWLYYSTARRYQQVSGLTLIVRNRLPNKVVGPDGVARWLYQIVEGKYQGRYVSPTGDTTFTPIPH